MSDINQINHPKHYGGDDLYEVTKVLEARLTPEEFRGFCKGNNIKYTLRAEDKHGMRDYEAAAWYAQRYIDYEKRGRTPKPVEHIVMLEQGELFTASIEDRVTGLEKLVGRLNKSMTDKHVDDSIARKGGSPRDPRMKGGAVHNASWHVGGGGRVIMPGINDEPETHDELMAREAAEQGVSMTLGEQARMTKLGGDDEHDPQLTMPMPEQPYGHRPEATPMGDAAVIAEAEQDRARQLQEALVRSDGAGLTDHDGLGFLGDEVSREHMRQRVVERKLRIADVLPALKALGLGYHPSTTTQMLAGAVCDGYQLNHYAEYELQADLELLGYSPDEIAKAVKLERQRKSASACDVG